MREVDLPGLEKRQGSTLHIAPQGLGDLTVAKREKDKKLATLKKDSEEADELMDVYRLDVGLPDPNRGKSAGAFCLELILDRSQG